MAAAVVLMTVPSVSCSRLSRSAEVRRRTSSECRALGLTAEDRETVARTAIGVMARLAVVRGRVHRDELAGARCELEEVLAMTDRIAAAAPTWSLRERIVIAGQHLGYESPDDVLPELYPIARQLDLLAEAIPTEEARQHLEGAQRDLRAGDAAAAARALDALDAAVVFQEIDLPLVEARADIARAFDALATGKPEDADALLERAESAMEVLTVWAARGD
jgi:hypothetical protein